MLDDIFSDKLLVADCSDAETIFSDEPDYNDLVFIKKKLTKEWAALDEAQRKKFNNKIGKFFQEKCLIDPNSSEAYSAKNWHLVNAEIEARLQVSRLITQIEINQIDYSNTVIEFLENIENIELIKKLYKLRKRNVGREKNQALIQRSLDE